MRANNRKRDMIGIIGGAVLLLAVPVMLLAGCGSSSGGYNSDRNIKAALKHMNDAYGTEFTYIEPYVGKSGNTMRGNTNFVGIYAKSSDLPNKKIHIFSADGKVFSDDYIYRKYEDEWTQTVTEAAQSVYGGRLRVIMDDEFMSSSFTKNTAAADLYRVGSSFTVTVFTCDSKDFTGDFGRLADALAAKGIDVSLRVDHFTDDSFMEAESIADSMEQGKYLGFAAYDSFDGSTMNKQPDNTVSFMPYSTAEDKEQDNEWKPTR